MSKLQSLKEFTTTNTRRKPMQNIYLIDDDENLKKKLMEDFSSSKDFKFKQIRT